MTYGIIYKVLNKVNGKIYIGQTIKDLKVRKALHIYGVNNNSQVHFHRALRKYGEDAFSWEIIDSANDIESLNQKEIYWIKYYDSFNNGYNMTIGGGGICGFSMSEETKKKIGEGNTGKVTGVNHHNARTIIQLSLDGDFISKFITITEATKSSDLFKGDISSIHSCCNNYISSAYGFIWIYEDDYCHEYVSERVKTYIEKGAERRVVKLDIDGNFIESFKSLTEASRSVNGDASAIARCCRGKASKHKGFKWMYRHEYLETKGE